MLLGFFQRSLLRYYTAAARSPGWLPPRPSAPSRPDTVLLLPRGRSIPHRPPPPPPHQKLLKRAPLRVTGSLNGVCCCSCCRNTSLGGGSSGGSLSNESADSSPR